MKSLHALLEEIKSKNPDLYAEIEKQIHGEAQKMGIQVQDDPPETEHPHKPPHQP